MILKRFRLKRGMILSHQQMIGEGARDFIKFREEVPDNEVFSFKVNGYQNKIFLRNGTSDVATFYQCIFNKEYDIPIDFEPKVIVDLGANIGLTSAFFKAKYPTAKVIAVEPESSNFEILKKNLENLSDVNLIQAGIWNKDGHLEIVDKGLGHYGYMVHEVPSATEKSIQAVSLNSIIEKNNIDKIDVLKIDIEGSEKALFSENTEWLKFIKVIIIELHDRMEEGCAKTFFKAIENYPYSLSMKGENLIIKLNSAN
ncbi:FkbM family methyltransferase [Paracrocinitomix mangrovi]|uniref:FkbM family methyltransferase n=1 Tax=Paracrocinitomix mangrovi TaxID=2862509 RepID=UPI001C8E063D|nr:FkbM family methyltransferase [Paracrocinitomix mangrovi]UKN01561.1 FkbM family methyltransferase [Paracrocinitomix mangrovi]